MRMVVGECARPVFWDAVIGMGAAIGSSRLLAGLLYEIRPSDPYTLAAVVGTLAIVAVIAAVPPARRAAR